MPTIAAINNIARDYQQNGDSLSEEKTSRISTVLTGIEFIQANVYLSSNNLVTPEHLGHFFDWINQVNGRWILKALLLPRLPTTESFATNLLPCAVRANDLEAVLFLLSVGASPNTTTTVFTWVVDPPPTKPYKSALCEAIRNSNVLFVKTLLEHGAEVNPAIHKSCIPTPLQEAVLLADPGQILEVLLRYGANVDPAESPDFAVNGQLSPPLTLAVASGNAWTVQILLKAGAHID